MVTILYFTISRPDWGNLFISTLFGGCGCVFWFLMFSKEELFCFYFCFALSCDFCVHDFHPLEGMKTGFHPTEGMKRLLTVTGMIVFCNHAFHPPDGMKTRFHPPGGKKKSLWISTNIAKPHPFKSWLLSTLFSFPLYFPHDLQEQQYDLGLLPE